MSSKNTAAKSTSSKKSEDMTDLQSRMDAMKKGKNATNSSETKAKDVKSKDKKDTSEPKVKKTRAKKAAAAVAKPVASKKDSGDESFKMEDILRVLRLSDKFTAAQVKALRNRFEDDVQLHSAANTLAVVLKEISETRTGSSVIKKVPEEVVTVFLEHLLGPTYTTSKDGKTTIYTEAELALNEALPAFSAGYTTAEHVSLMIKLLPQVNTEIVTKSVEKGLPNTKAFVLDTEVWGALSAGVDALNEKRKKTATASEVALDEILSRDLSLVVMAGATELDDGDEENIEEYNQQLKDELHTLTVVLKALSK
jgi:hypothetical protein